MRKIVTIATIAAILLIVAYLAHFGHLDLHSRFLVIDIIGTRSEIGFEWDTPSLFVSTHEK